MIDAFLSQLSYANHLAPIWHALPEDRRGLIYADQNADELQPAVTPLGLTLTRGRPPSTGDPLLMASGADLWAWEARPVILIEHGAAQTYNAPGASNACYTGGQGRNAVALYLSPNQAVADKNLAAYPDAHAVVVGDPTIRRRESPTSDLVAVSWHWPAPLCPESGCTWPWWQQAALDLAQERPVLGHAHPKIGYKIGPWWERNGVEYTAQFNDVLDRAAVYVIDNSSTGPEFAATGRPIVWLNCPSYRRSVHHGNRFWEWSEMAINCDEPHRLPWAIDEALEDRPEIQDKRAAWCERIYAYTGETALQRSVEAILGFSVA